MKLNNRGSGAKGQKINIQIKKGKPKGLEKELEQEKIKDKKEGILKSSKVKSVGDIKQNDSRKVTKDRKRVVKLERDDEAKPKKDWGKYVLGIGAVGIGVIAAAAIVYYLVISVFFSSGELAKRAPEDVSLFATINLNTLLMDSSSSAQELLRTVPAFAAAKNGAEKKIGELLSDANLEYTEVMKVLGNEVAIVGLESKNELRLVVMLKTADLGQAEDLIKKLDEAYDFKAEELNGVTVYETHFVVEAGSPLWFYLSDEGVITISNSEKNIEEIMKVENNQKLSLADSDAYKKVAKNFLPGSFFKVYLSPQNLENIKYLEDDSRFSLLRGFYSNIPDAGLSLKAEKNGLKVGTYIDQAGAGTEIRFDEKSYLPREITAAVLGYNLSRELKDAKSELRNNSPAALQIVEGVEETLKRDWGMELESDVLSLLKEDYGIVLFPQDEGQQNIGLAVKVSDAEKSKEMMGKVEKSWQTYYAKLHPREEEITLEDGTKAIELLPDVNALSFTDLKYEEVLVRTITHEDVRQSFSYAFLDNQLLAATSLDSLKQMIDAGKTGVNLGSDESFQASFNSVPSKGNSLYYVNIPVALAVLGQSFGDTLTMKNFVMTQRVSGEGIVSEGFVLVE